LIIDSLTQIVLGAAVGEAVLGKKIGYNAAIWGAVCGTIPDLDVLLGVFMQDLDKNLFHRSISHSLLFFFLFSPITGWLLKRLYPRQQVSFKEWTLLAFWSYFTHALLDSFTTWGTQLFWPWGYKVAFKSIFVIDPLYTIPLLIFLILAICKKRNAPKRATLNWVGLIISSTYLCITVVNKQIVHHNFKNEAIGYHIGYKSFLDKDSNIPFEFFQKNHHLIASVHDNVEIKKIITLTDGWYTVESTNYGFLINDLRFGTNTAWKPGGEFVFSYKIEVENKKVIAVSESKKTFKEDPKSILLGLLYRIAGI